MNKAQVAGNAKLASNKITPAIENKIHELDMVQDRLNNIEHRLESALNRIRQEPPSDLNDACDKVAEEPLTLMAKLEVRNANAFNSTERIQNLVTDLESYV